MAARALAEDPHLDDDAHVRLRNDLDDLPDVGSVDAAFLVGEVVVVGAAVVLRRWVHVW